VGSCLCSAESTSVVAASVVGVLGAFASEFGSTSVWWDGVLGGLEHLRGGWGWGVRWGRFLGGLEHLGRRVLLIHRRGHGRGKEKKSWYLHRCRHALLRNWA
jgi:hypothetical protein